MRYKASTLRIIEKLKELYPEGLCSLQYEKDYELLFAVRLSAQCTDARVNLVTPALFARFPTLKAFAEADPKEVGEYIHSCGFYNGKARDLVSCAQQLIERFDGRVPDNMEDLTSLSGVGRKTANLILGDVYGQPSYVSLHPHHRAAGNHGWLQGPGKSGAAAPPGHSPGGIRVILSPDGALRPGCMHRPVPQMRRLSPEIRLRRREKAEIILFPMCL